MGSLASGIVQLDRAWAPDAQVHARMNIITSLDRAAQHSSACLCVCAADPKKLSRLSIDRPTQHCCACGFVFAAYAAKVSTASFLFQS